MAKAPTGKRTSSSADRKARAKASELSGVIKKAKALGIDTRKQEAMVKQTERQGARAFEGSREERDYKKSIAITPEKVTPVETPPAPPTVPTPTTPDITGAGNTGLASSLAGLGYTQDANGLFVAPKEDAGTSVDMSGQANAMQQYLGNILGNKPPSAEKTYADVERQVGLQKAQREVNNYTAQLNTIVAESQAAQLGLEGQGRGITETIIGGQQAQINREAAIKALPIQALLGAAQGNLEFAQQRVDTLFKLRMQDSQAQYDLKNKVYETYYNFASDIQKAKLDSLKTKEDRTYAERQQSIADAKNIAMQAIEYGQSSLASRIMGLDSKSATYAQDVANAMGQLRKPVEAVSTKRDTQVVDGKLIDMQTGEVISTIGAENGDLIKVSSKEIQDLNDTQIAKNSLVSLVDDMTKSIKKYGTKVFWGAEAGSRGSAKTNLLLAMKNLEKTGALDKGTIDVLAETIPENEFFATEARQIAALERLKETVIGKADEYIGSYRGTTAETDPRTSRIYETNIDMSLFDDTDIQDIDSLFGTSLTTQSFNPASYY